MEKRSSILTTEQQILFEYNRVHALSFAEESGSTVLVQSDQLLCLTASNSREVQPQKGEGGIFFDGFCVFV